MGSLRPDATVVRTIPLSPGDCATPLRQRVGWLFEPGASAIGRGRFSHPLPAFHLKMSGTSEIGGGGLQ